MPSVQEPMHSAPELADVIEHSIMQRTWGRVHRLKVQVQDDRVIVSGCTSCYYVKQLALEGILDAVGQKAPPEIDLEIEVSGYSSASTSHRHNPEPHAASY